MSCYHKNKYSAGENKEFGWLDNDIMDKNCLRETVILMCIAEWIKKGLPSGICECCEMNWRGIIKDR